MSKMPTLQQLLPQKSKLDVQLTQKVLVQKNKDAAREHLLRIQLILAQRPIK